MNRVIQEHVEWLSKQIARTIAMEQDVEIVQKIMPNAHVWVGYDGISVIWGIEPNANVEAEVGKLLEAFAEKGVFLKSMIAKPERPEWFLGGKFCDIRLSPYRKLG